MTATRVADAFTGWTERLPPPVRRWVTRELVGFAILGGLTFGVDLALLWALRRWTPLPVPVAVTASYVAAVALNYVLNRKLNFRSHAPVVGEASRYTIVMAGDYLLTVGVTSGLTAVGVSLAAARLLAAAFVALFNFVAARWWIFRR
ncbi:GtrA family protein [Asanoa sp. NPDC050611]|uniref:GtrA family protein n=1 Tax=Asanoa sp. NPDC050611 TaxID=3157098 RepID=UPI0033E79C8B